MRIIIGGKFYELISISPEMDIAFKELHSSFFSNLALNWDDFNKVAKAFFDENFSNSSAVDNYFSNFTIIWKEHIKNGIWDLAEDTWQLALESAFDWERINTPQKLHKGTAYYFWGMTCILRGNIDRGYLLMHLALAEDARTFKIPFPDTPSFAFASLNFEKVSQAFLDWVNREARFLNRQIENYYVKRSKEYSLSIFKEHFLQKPPNIDTVYLFSYTIARIISLDALPEFFLKSSFSGQMLQNILFDLLQIVDTSIKAKNPSQWKMIDHIHFLSKSSKNSLSIKELTVFNKKLSSDFEVVLANILDAKYLLSDGSSPNSLQRDLLLVYGLRNHGAHDISAYPIIWKRYKELRSSIFNILFLTVQTLY